MKLHNSTGAVTVFAICFMFAETTQVLFTIDFTQHKDESGLCKTVLMNDAFAGCFSLQSAWYNGLFNYDTEEWTRTRNMLFESYA